MSAETKKTVLTGWGRTAPSAATVIEVIDGASVVNALTHAPARGAIARGLGRSYGDAALNGGGLVLDTARWPGDLSIDTSTGIVTAGAGVSLDTIMRALVPHGWFVPVTPGTRYVTVGGAIASDIHGKNHHVDGSFADHVVSFELALPSGEIRTVTPADDPEVFWATAGGMGLTGIVVRASFQAIAISSSRVLVDTVRTEDLDATMAEMSDGDARYRYSVAWLDSLASGRSLGRGVITSGDHAPADVVDADPLAFDPSVRIGAPNAVPAGLLNRTSIRVFNEVWFRKAPRHRIDEVQSLQTFFHPLDMIRDWNRIYGRRGFVQYQFVVPLGAEGTLRTVIERLVEFRAASFLTVLKRFGPANPGMLSFPTAGWTLALDIPAGVGGLAELLDGCDRFVLDSGGRLYLAKDARMAPSSMAAMYPRLEEWQAVRRRLDPTGVLQSDLGRRLGLCGHNALEGP